ncbi:MAG: hypothetical protein BWX79_01586 [Alphaproteobacteria bacterium ADurb.Bin100]|jgi:hypothetical protein|nr:MAG: hypothetical protein BWX79_01586 [Alphaproteobacteria bacterium ADurb.Bin100]
MITPTSIPTTPQTTVMMANWRTTVSLYTVACAFGNFIYSTFT